METAVQPLCHIVQQLRSLSIRRGYVHQQFHPTNFFSLFTSLIRARQVGLAHLFHQIDNFSNDKTKLVRHVLHDCSYFSSVLSSISVTKLVQTNLVSLTVASMAS